MNLSKHLPIIALVAAFIVGIAVWLRTNGKKAMNMAEYSLLSLKLHNVGIITSTIKASLLVKNPSELAMKVNSYKVELIHNNNGEKNILAETPVSSLTIPANGNIVNDMVFNVSNINLLKFVSGALKAGIEQQFKGKITIRVKAEILGNYLEREIPYL